MTPGKKRKVAEHAKKTRIASALFICRGKLIGRKGTVLLVQDDKRDQHARFAVAALVTKSAHHAPIHVEYDKAGLRVLFNYTTDTGCNTIFSPSLTRRITTKRVEGI